MKQLVLASFSLPTRAVCGWRSLDLPLLGEAIDVAASYHRRGEAGDALLEVEALVALHINDLTGSVVNPPLCTGPVAGEQSDQRTVRRSAAFNVETDSVHIGRSKTL